MKYRWCALAVLPITFLSLWPQIRFCAERGSSWHGAYIVLQPDEVLYSAYINALIDGRPRLNDPAKGQDNNSDAPLPESLFSVQFLPPFVLASVGRATGISASGMFIALLGIAGLLSSLAVFWLIASITGNNALAAVGVLVVFCFGTVVAGQGIVGLMFKPDVRFLGFPFLRRYEPAAPFPLLLVFCTITWLTLTCTIRWTRMGLALLAGAIFAALIFSYFYLWTLSAAWLVCIGFLWLLMRPAERKASIQAFAVACVPVLIAFGFYFNLVSRLPAALNKAQGMTFTHRPDLWRIPEMVGGIVILLLILGIRRHKLSLTEPKVIFTLSLGLLPAVVFNQQLITGRSMQPFHYEVLMGNYMVLIALVLAIGLLKPIVRRWTAVAIVTLCLALGSVETSLAFQANYASAVRNDEMVPVFTRLREQATLDGTWEGLRNNGRAPALVFSPHYGIYTLLATWAPQGSLLAPGSVSFQTSSEAERKEWLYMHLYYSGKNTQYISELLNDRVDDPFLTHFARSTIFGPERVVMFLGWDFQPIRQEEIDREANAYKAFIESFSLDQAARRPVRYAVILTNSAFDFSHLDRWYDHDAGERVGAYTLYQLALRRVDTSAPSNSN